jgi:hypothetical protein
MKTGCRSNLTVERSGTFRIGAHSVQLLAVFAWISSITPDLPASTFSTRKYRSSTSSEGCSRLGHDFRTMVHGAHIRIPTDVVKNGNGCKEI